MVCFIPAVNDGPIQVEYVVDPERRFKSIQGFNHEKLKIKNGYELRFKL